MRVMEPNTTILTRIHASHPSVQVIRGELSGKWEATFPVSDTGSHVIYRRYLADIETKLNDLDGRRRLRRKARTS